MRSVLLGLLSALILLLCAPRAQADPVDLLEADSQCFVQDNGAMDVIYSLKFRDNGSRTMIRKVGQFYQPIHFTRALLHGVGGVQRVTTSSLGGGYYSVSFPRATRSGGIYTLELHFRSNRRFADPTVRDNQQLLAVWYNPVRWTLPVQRSVIKLVLPLKLPPEVQQHEQITPRMVNELGVLTDPNNKSSQDKFAFVYTDYRKTRRLTIYAERRQLSRQATHLLRTYIPRASLPGLAAGRNVEASGGAVAEMLTAKGRATLQSEAYEIYGNMPQVRTIPWSDRQERELLVRTKLTFRERGERNFLPLPSVRLETTKRGKLAAPACTARLGGEEVSCSPRSNKTLVLGKPSKPGQTIEVQLEQRFRFALFPAVRSRGGTPFVRVEFTGLPASFAPRGGLKRSELTLFAGTPMLGAEVLPLRLVEPGREAAQLRPRSVDWSSYNRYKPSFDYPEAGAKTKECVLVFSRKGDLSAPTRLAVLLPSDPLNLERPTTTALGVLVSRLFSSDLAPRDKASAWSLVLWFSLWSVLAFLFNWLLLGLWFISIGWVLLIIDKIAGTHMCRDVLLPAGKWKWVHPTKGNLLGLDRRAGPPPAGLAAAQRAAGGAGGAAAAAPLPGALPQEEGAGVRLTRDHGGHLPAARASSPSWTPWRRRW